MMNSAPLTLSALEQRWPEFVLQIQDFMAELGLDKLNLSCDHAALRVNSRQGAEQLHAAFCRRGRLLSNKVINARPILIIALDRPLQFGDQAIRCVELPYPGEKRYPVEGWEHVELVLPGDADSIDALKEQLLKALPQLAPVLAGATDIGVKCSAPASGDERLANPSIAFKRGQLCIKIHPHAIEKIIASTQPQPQSP